MQWRSNVTVWTVRTTMSLNKIKQLEILLAAYFRIEIMKWMYNNVNRRSSMPVFRVVPKYGIWPAPAFVVSLLILLHLGMNNNGLNFVYGYEHQYNFIEGFLLNISSRMDVFVWFWKVATRGHQKLSCRSSFKTVLM